MNTEFKINTNPSKIIKLKKISDRVLNQKNISLIRRRTRLENVDYEVFGHEEDKLDKEKFIFTISIVTYNRYEYAKIAINSVLRQTYKNIELILIDQCANEQVSALCNEFFQSNSNVKLIRTRGKKLEFNDFKFFDDIDEPLINIWNAALFVSIGHGIFGLCDDDFLNEVYVEKIVNLFIENKNCVTAGSDIQTINEHGIKNELYFKYQHERYTPAKSFLENYMMDKNFFGAPGSYFCVRSDVIIKEGGWDYVIDWSPIFRFMIYGDHGYDPNAILHWRHHIGQAHWLNHCCVFYNSRLKWLLDYNVANNITKEISEELSQKFIKFYKNFIFDEMKLSFMWACRSGQLANIIGVAKEIRKQEPNINIYKHVSMIDILKTYLFANLLQLYSRSPVFQKYWKKIKLHMTRITELLKFN